MISDFIYNDIRLSELGYIICTFSSGGDIDTIATDSQRSYSHLSLFNGNYQPFVVVNYSDVIQSSFSICKNPCVDDDPVFSVDEIRKIKRWLSPASPKKFFIPDNYEYDGIHWEGIFNVEEVKYAGKIIGFDLTFESNRPYAVGEKEIFSLDVKAGGTMTVANNCDEEGYIYPKITVTCQSDGCLVLTNTTFQNGEPTVVKNCTNGEIITITPELQIGSSLPNHKLSKDFNWKFIKLWNYGDTRDNEIKCSLASHCLIEYTPSRKVVFS